MADLVTLDEARAVLGYTPSDTRDDPKLTALIPYATKAIINWTERDFASDPVTEERPFEYDGSGYLDIDDATAVTSVALTVPHGSDLSLTSDDWVALPSRRDDSPVYYYLALGGAGYGFSAEMGFMRNLDVYVAEGRLRTQPVYYKVVADWGWPEVPGDVKLATIWTLQDWISKPSGDNLSSEAIEGWARSWGNRLGGSMALAIPNRARDLLEQYRKQRV